MTVNRSRQIRAGIARSEQEFDRVLWDEIVHSLELRCAECGERVAARGSGVEHKTPAAQKSR